MMEISKSGTRSINKGPVEFFKGDVSVDALFKAPDPARVQGASVTFQPCARTAWHTHPLGQTLVVTDGCGIVQCWGQPAQIIRPGDVIWTPPGVKHWHGALPTSKMTHFAILENLNGKNVDWMEQLTEDEYRSGCAECEQSSHDLGTVSPALEKFDNDTIAGLWAEQGLTARDRSIVTLSALIARNQGDVLPLYLKFALDNGVKPVEVSEIILHLAFYSGWPNAMAAANLAKPIFAQRNITVADLPLVAPNLLTLDEKAEKVRSTNVENQYGNVAPGVVRKTTDLLFRNLWLRPDLKPRDRSLVTVSALVASGQVAQIPYHLNRAMDNGLTQAEASEVLTHLAFYAGWPCVFSAMPVFKEVFEKRSKLEEAR